MNSNQPVFQLFGLDVMLDTDLKPWLLEVNSHPSMFPNKTGVIFVKHLFHRHSGTVTSMEWDFISVLMSAL